MIDEIEKIITESIRNGEVLLEDNSQESYDSYFKKTSKLMEELKTKVIERRENRDD